VSFHRRTGAGNDLEESKVDARGRRVARDPNKGLREQYVATPKNRSLFVAKNLLAFLEPNNGLLPGKLLVNRAEHLPIRRPRTLASQSRKFGLTSKGILIRHRKQGDNFRQPTHSLCSVRGKY
jgi:hypothetical protein